MIFPLDIRFRLLALAAKISVFDGRGTLQLQVNQKAFKLRESLTVYADEAGTQPLYTIAADRIIDFSASYQITDSAGRDVGVVRRQGMRSLWRARYEIARGGETLFEIAEGNPWVKVADGLIGELPVVGLLSGYLLHPRYDITDRHGSKVLTVLKQPALFEGKYKVEQSTPLNEDDQLLATLGLVVMLMLERTRG